MAQTTASLPQGLFFDFLRQDEVDDAYALEVQGFPPDEAATREKLGCVAVGARLGFRPSRTHIAHILFFSADIAKRKLPISS